MRFFTLIFCLFINTALFSMEMESVKKSQPLQMTTEKVKSPVQEITYEPMIQSPEPLIMQANERCSEHYCCDSKEAAGAVYCCGGASVCCGSTAALGGAAFGSSIVAVAGLVLAAVGCGVIAAPYIKKCLKCCKDTVCSEEEK